MSGLTKIATFFTAGRKNYKETSKNFVRLNLKTWMLYHSINGGRVRVLNPEGQIVKKNIFMLASVSLYFMVHIHNDICPKMAHIS